MIISLDAEEFLNQLVQKYMSLRYGFFVSVNFSEIRYLLKVSHFVVKSISSPLITTCLLLEIGSQVAQVGLTLTTQLRIILKF